MTVPELFLSLALVSIFASCSAAEIDLGLPEERPDRLVTINGSRTEALVAECSTDGGATWHPATIYPGSTVDEWRSTSTAVWNAAALDGVLPAGENEAVWNHFFDIDLSSPIARFRLRTQETGETVLERDVDLTPLSDLTVIDRRNVAALCADGFRAPWELKPAGAKLPAVASIFQRVARKKVPTQGSYYRYEVDNVDPSPLVIPSGLQGRHRIYVGLEPHSALRFWLSEDDVRYEVPNYYSDAHTAEGAMLTDRSTLRDRFCRDYFIASADLTDQDICIAPGGTRFWRDVSVRYIRLVPMTPAEVESFRSVRELAREKGRQFAGYLEPVTPAHYIPRGTIGLREHIHNEMRLNQARGSNDVYMHVIRIGCVAWYHSDVVERGEMFGWEKQGDPMAIGVEEAHALGLKFFADAGMNSTYAGNPEKGFTARFTKEHPEYLYPGHNKMCFDYRLPEVRDYINAILREFMHKYDVDGVNLDFGRWSYPGVYDVDSLVLVFEQAHRNRLAAQEKWGHPVAISTRIDYEAPPAEGAEPPVFVRALKRWAQAGYVDRVMLNADEKLSGDLSLAQYLEAIDGTDTRLWGDMYWGTWHRKTGGPRADLAIARQWVDQGLNGGLYYYMRGRPIEWEQINWQMRLIDFPDVVVGPGDR